MERLVLQARHATKGLKRLKLEAEAKQTQLENLEAKISLGDEELQRNLARLEDLRVEAEQVEARMIEQEIRFQKTEQQINDKLLALASTEQRIETSKAAKASLERHLSHLTASHSQAVDELKKVEKQVIVVRAEYEEQSDVLRMELAQLMKQREQLIGEERELRASMAVLNESFASASLAARSYRMTEDPETDSAAEPVAMLREPPQEPLQQTAEESLQPSAAVTLPESPAALATESALAADGAALMPEPVDQQIEDVWSTVQELSQLVHDSRLNDSLPIGPASDPWSTVLADVASPGEMLVGGQMKRVGAK